MASSSSNFKIPTSLSLPVGEKLNKTNYFLWQAQVLPAIRGAQLEGILDGSMPAPPTEIDEKVDNQDVKKPNPEYARWVAQDQAVLSYLLSSLTRDALASVASLKTSAEVWRALAEMFASQTRARTVSIRISLATAKKGGSSVVEYYSKMKRLADEMAAAGKALGDEEIVSYIITGLEEDYNPLVSAVLARDTPMSPSELYSHMLSYESRLEMQSEGQGSQSSANYGGRSGGRNNHGGGGGRGRGRGENRGAYNNNTRSNSASNNNSTIN